MYKKIFKRFFDILFSITLILALFPVMIFLFFIIWFFIGFPIFKQERPGQNNKIFTIYKFKTMYDFSGNVSENRRLNNLGIFLRKTGLDELPQLFNVLKNNMSLVGPRPLLVDYLKNYSKYEKKRHDVKPGITGLAQINPEISGVKSWSKSIKLDIYYVENLSFSLDVQILFKTLKLIIFKKKQYNDFKKTF